MKSKWHKFMRPYGRRDDLVRRLANRILRLASAEYRGTLDRIIRTELTRVLGDEQKQDHIDKTP